MTLVVRFVKLAAAEHVFNRKHFFGFVLLANSSGEGLTEVLLKELQTRGIHLCNMRGQGYGNGSEMKAKHVGVQKRICDFNPRAFHVPYGNQSLKLVINDAALFQCCSRLFQYNSRNLHFFTSSTNRWNILFNKVSNLTVKPLYNRRGEGRTEVLLPLRYHIEEVYDV